MFYPLDVVFDEKVYNQRLNLKNDPNFIQWQYLNDQIYVLQIDFNSLCLIFAEVEKLLNRWERELLSQ